MEEVKEQPKTLIKGPVLDSQSSNFSSKKHWSNLWSLIKQEYKDHVLYAKGIELPFKLVFFCIRQISHLFIAIIGWFKQSEPRWKTITVTLLLIAIMVSALLYGGSASKAASFNFTQNSWSGGASAATAAHPGDESNWNKYSSTTHTDTSSGVKITTYSGNTFNGANSDQNTKLNAVDTNVSSATLNSTETGGTGTISYQMSDDGGSSWNNITKNVLFNFPSPGNDLRYRATTSAVPQPSSNLVGYWNMDASSGTNVADSSGSGGNGTISGSVSWTTGQINNGLSFTGGYVDLGRPNAITNLNTLTVSAWVNGTGPIFGNNSSGSFAFSVDGTGHLVADSSNNANICISTGTVSLGVWSHVAVTYNNMSGACVFYINGVSAGSSTHTTTLETFGSYEIGRTLAGSFITFNGSIDELRIYNVVLNSTQITTLYNDRLTTPGTNAVSTVSINYSGTYAAADLTSSPYNAADAENLVSKIAWSASNTSATETVKFQIRTAPDSSGAPGTWSNWCGFADCSGSTYFSSSDNNVNLPGGHPLRSGGDDQWFQYKVFLTGAGTASPILNSVTITYVVNAPPDFNPNYPTNGAGGVSVSQITDSTDPNYNKVVINYSIRDIDTTTGTNTPGFVTPTFQYNIGSGWVSINPANMGTNDTANEAVSESSYTTYTATWNAAAQIPNQYLTTAQIRVTVNDNEAANNTATATSANFTLDTKPPVATLNIDNSQNQITLTGTDDTALQYRVSNNADYSPDGVNATSGEWQTPGGSSFSLTPNWTPASNSGPQTIYAQVRDTAGNVTSLTAVAPGTPGDMYIQDISNVKAASFKEFISWDVYSNVTGAAFSQYEIYRSTDGTNFSLLNTITDVNTNYYADQTVSAGTTYYYKVRVKDTTNDYSGYSTTVSDLADGQGGTDTTPPRITAVTVAENQATYAKITWTTDELATSEIDYSISPSTAFDTTVTSPSFVTAHSLTVTGLDPNTTYLFEVKSSDVFGNTATENNSGNGFLITTTSGPKISNVTQTSVNEHAATITWNTDVDSDSFVTYSTNANMTNPTKIGSATLVGGSSPIFQHSVDLSGLIPATTYYYFVESKDASNNNSKDNNGGNFYSFNTTLDNTPPVISDISVPVTSLQAAAIVWTTDEPATTQIDYGTTSGTYDTTTTLDTTLTTFHLVSLSSLTENTKYYFDVRSKDSGDNEAVSPENNFTTDKTTIVTLSSGGGGSTDVKDTTPPTISAIKISDIQPFGATISFTTSEDAVGLVNYGFKDKILDSSASGSDFETQHTLKLVGLQMGTDYSFQIKAFDKAGNIGTSDAQNFTTTYLTDAGVNINDAYQFQQATEDAIESALPTLVPPFVEKPEITNIGQDSATLTFRSNIAAYAVAAYAEDKDYNSSNDNPYPLQISDTQDKVTDHTLQLVGLKPNTKYHVSAQAYRIPGAVGKSPDLTFVTKAGKIEAKIANTTNTSFRVVWNTDEPATSIVNYTDAATKITVQKVDASKTTFHDETIDNLAPGSSFDIQVSGVNNNGNVLQTSDSLHVTLSKDTTPPQISSLEIQSAFIPGKSDVTQTIVSWKTDEPSNSTVYYEEGAGTAGSTKPLSNKVDLPATYVTDHSVVVTNLKAGGLYRIQVASADPAGNLTTFPVRTIVIPQQSQSVLDIIFKNFEDTFGFLKK